MSEQQGPRDLEAVRAEVDRLKEEVEKLEAKPQKRARLRKVFVVVFIGEMLDQRRKFAKYAIEGSRPIGHVG